jgi:hypothetical protein
MTAGTVVAAAEHARRQGAISEAARHMYDAATDRRRAFSLTFFVT